eukprot:Hpha_TRINITY_DN4124_c0_g1::TRINITY_DN4124_c0_g1_i1::g.194668::m.194668
MADAAAHQKDAAPLPGAEGAPAPPPQGSAPVMGQPVYVQQPGQQAYPQAYPQAAYPQQQYPGQQYPQAYAQAQYPVGMVQPVQPQQVVFTGAHIQWQHGLICPCCVPCEDTGLCCDAFWCGFCQLARQWAAVKHGRSNDPNWPVCGAIFGTFCAIATCSLMVTKGISTGPAGCVTWLTLWHLRERLRSNLNIEGNVCSDCIESCCCQLCSMVQMHRELKARGVDPGYTCCPSDFGPGVVQQGYAQNYCHQ